MLKVFAATVMVRVPPLPVPNPTLPVPRLSEFVPVNVGLPFSVMLVTAFVKAATLVLSKVALPAKTKGPAPSAVEDPKFKVPAVMVVVPV